MLKFHVRSIYICKLILLMQDAKWSFAVSNLLFLSMYKLCVAYLTHFYTDRDQNNIRVHTSNIRGHTSNIRVHTARKFSYVTRVVF